MPPYTPVEWLRQEERTFAAGEVRLVVTLKVLDGLVVSRDPQYAGANAPRTCMIMCEMPAAQATALPAATRAVSDVAAGNAVACAAVVEAQAAAAEVAAVQAADAALR
eukprot:COSAG06_NODE_47962_length_335_cov_1.296610_1_plen_107_part_01